MVYNGDIIIYFNQKEHHVVLVENALKAIVVALLMRLEPVALFLRPYAKHYAIIAFFILR